MWYYRYHDHDVVCVGGGGWSTLETMTKLEMRRLLTMVAHETLINVYLAVNMRSRRVHVVSTIPTFGQMAG